MPFGRKLDDSGRWIDFDRVYREIIGPSCAEADLEPIRADEEVVGGVIHKPMFERLLLCDYAVADLTTANANVFYELGIRHGVRPHTTVIVFGEGMRLPFDVTPLRGLAYQLDANGAPQAPALDKERLKAALVACRQPTEDSPLFQLVSGWPRPDIARLKTDVFRQAVDYEQTFKRRLAQARTEGRDAVRAIGRELDIQRAEPAFVVDLLLSYRAVQDWESMVEIGRAPNSVISRSVLVQEQLGFALNRLQRHVEAEQVLKGLIASRGPSSETNGLLGRVYKDLWEHDAKEGRGFSAAAWLKLAVETYLDGFNADWRDAYPGVNVVTLMELMDPVDPRQADLLPVVRFSNARRLAAGAADYWDHATRLELAVLASDRLSASSALLDAIARIREVWEPGTTLRNLQLIRRARELRGIDCGWIREIERGLSEAQDRLRLDS